MDTVAKLQKLILQRGGAEITATSSIADSMLDSIEQLYFLFDIETTFGVRVDQRIITFVTYGDLARYIEELAVKSESQV